MNKTYQKVQAENASLASSPTPPDPSVVSMSNANNSRTNLLLSNTITVNPYAKEFQNGEKILKHVNGASPHPRKIRIKDGKLTWGQGWNAKSINMKEIHQLIIGKFTPTFTNRDNVSTPAELCLSIVTKNRDLDIQFYSIQQRNKWVNVIVSILHSLRKSITHLKSLEQLIYGQNTFDSTMDINGNPLICAVTDETVQELQNRLSVPSLAKVDEGSAEIQSSEITPQQIPQSPANFNPLLDANRPNTAPAHAKPTSNNANNNQYATSSVNYASNASARTREQQPTQTTSVRMINISSDMNQIMNNNNNNNTYKTAPSDNTNNKQVFISPIQLNNAMDNPFTASMLEDQRQISMISNQSQGQNINHNLAVPNANTNINSKSKSQEMNDKLNQSMFVPSVDTSDTMQQTIATIASMHTNDIDPNLILHSSHIVDNTCNTSTAINDNINVNDDSNDTTKGNKGDFDFDQQLRMSMQLLARQSVNFTTTLLNSANHTPTKGAGGANSNHDGYGDDSAEITIAQVDKIKTQPKLNFNLNTKRATLTAKKQKTKQNAHGSIDISSQSQSQSQSQARRFSTQMITSPKNYTNVNINTINKPQSNKNSRNIHADNNLHDYSSKQYIKSLENDLEMQTKLKEKSQRKCDYLENTINEINSQLSKKQKLVNTLKQKVETLETEKYTIYSEKIKLSEQIDYKLKDLNRRETSIKKHVQKSAAIQKKYEILQTENIEIKDQLTRLQEMYDELEIKLQNRDSNDRRLTLELNKWKIKNSDLVSKLKLEKAKQKELSQSIDTIKNEAKLQMEKQRLSFLTKLKESVNVIKSYEVQMEKINKQNQELQSQVATMETDYQRGQIITQENSVDGWNK